ERRRRRSSAVRGVPGPGPRRARAPARRRARRQRPAGCSGSAARLHPRTSYARRAMDDVTLARFAELAVDFGANVQPGQVVSLSGAPGKERLVRAIAERAYVKGAKFVDLAWFDPWIKRARIEHAPDDSIEYVPPWYGDRILTIGRERGSAITLSGPVAPGLMDDLDPVRSGRDRLPAIRETGEVVSRREINWTILPGPTDAWAQLVHPDLEPEAALTKLEEQLLHVLRLDEEDPVAAWRSRADRLVEMAG